jgi:hypothetical protein
VYAEYFNEWVNEWITTDDQSVSLSWCRAPSGAHDQILVLITIWLLLFLFRCRAPPLTERSGLSFVLVTWTALVQFSKFAAGPRQHINGPLERNIIAYFPWYETDHIENDASNNSSIVACVFVTAVTFVPSRCLATMGFFTDPLPGNDKGDFFTEPLPSNDKGDIQTATWSYKPTQILQNKGSRLKKENRLLKIW